MLWDPLDHENCIFQVSFDVNKNDNLGLTIRGGSEHGALGLGIYVTAVEEGSLAHLHNIKVSNFTKTTYVYKDLCFQQTRP